MRYDLAFATGVLSRHNHNPTQAHLEASKRVLQYLKGLKNFSLTYRWGAPLQLEAYADASYNCYPSKGKSIGGYLINLKGNSPIAWQLKRQPLVATSTCYAEYVALYHVGHMIEYMNYIVKGAGFQSYEVEVHEDNNAAIVLATKQSNHATTRALKIKYSKVHEWINEGLFYLSKVATEDQLSDFLTKAFAEERFVELRDRSNHKYNH